MPRDTYIPHRLFAAIVIITGLSVAGFMPADEPAAPINVHSLFLTENDYLDFISGEVRFDDVDLRVVGIRKGDNFWKIARDNGVNIDTLIGANPHWDTLTARLNQRIVVPSKVGVLNFITDPSEIEEIAELYGVERSKIRVQDLPPLTDFRPV